MENFTPLSAAIGGALIGIAVTILWAFNGRTAGVSGIFGGLYPPRRATSCGVSPSSSACRSARPSAPPSRPRVLAEVPSTLPEIGMAPVVAVVAGLLVGVGTRIGARLHLRARRLRHSPACPCARSSRSASFMATPIVTVFVVRHVAMNAPRRRPSPPASSAASSSASGSPSSRMIDPQKIKDFLDIAAIPSGGWDPSLAFVMGGGAAGRLLRPRLDRLMRKPAGCATI